MFTYIFTLETYRITDKVLQDFKRYLCKRSQKVVYKDVLSSNTCIKSGVPQGSVLRLLLFLIYFNDVSNKMLSFYQLFADDICIYYASHDFTSIEHNINHGLYILEQWYSRW